MGEGSEVAVAEEDIGEVVGEAEGVETWEAIATSGVRTTRRGTISRSLKMARLSSRRVVDRHAVEGQRRDLSLKELNNIVRLFAGRADEI